MFWHRLHGSRVAREEKVDPKNVKTKEMLSYEARQRGEITTARKGEKTLVHAVSYLLFV